MVEWEGMEKCMHIEFVGHTYTKEQETKPAWLGKKEKIRRNLTEFMEWRSVGFKMVFSELLHVG